MLPSLGAAQALLSGVPSNPSGSSLLGLLSNCYDYDIPVKTEAEILNWSALEFSDNYEVAQAIVSSIGRTPVSPFKGTRNITGNYTIGATFCSPKTFNGHEKTVILASPGLGYDRRYCLLIFRWRKH